MKDAKISARQTGMLAVMIILANSIMITPSVIFHEIGADAFFEVVLLTLFDLLVLGGFFMLKSKFPDSSLYEILQNNLGKFVAKVILTTILIFFLFKSLFTYAVVYTYLKRQVYQDGFEILALVCILPVVSHAVIAGLRSFSRTIELFFYVVIGGVLICLAMSFTNRFGLPLFFQTSAEKFFSSTFKHLFSFGDYVFLFLIMDKIDLKGDGRRVLKFAFLGIALLLAILFRFFSIFRITAFMHNNALVDISSVSAEYSSLGKLDIVSMLSVMFLTFFQLEIYVFGFCKSFEFIFPKLNKTHAIIVYNLLFFLLYYMLLSNYEFFIGITENYLPYLVIFINLVMPIMTQIITLKSARKYSKIF